MLQIHYKLIHKYTQVIYTETFTLNTTEIYNNYNCHTVYQSPQYKTIIN